MWLKQNPKWKETWNSFPGSFSMELYFFRPYIFGMKQPLLLSSNQRYFPNHLKPRNWNYLQFLPVLYPHDIKPIFKSYHSNHSRFSCLVSKYFPSLIKSSPSCVFPINPFIISILLGFSFRTESIFYLSLLKKLLYNPQINYYSVLIIDTIRSNSRKQFIQWKFQVVVIIIIIINTWGKGKNFNIFNIH